MEKSLTDRQHWKAYWEDAPFPKVEKKPFFYDLIEEHLPVNEASFLEIGGFPGTFSIFFNKYFSYKPTLLDFYIDQDLLQKFEIENGLNGDEVNILETDFLEYKAESKFDVVFSAGFIEHFDDTKEILKKHVDSLSEGGTLFVTLPNFRGLNGWLQFLFNRKNYFAHNLDSMKIKNLKKYAGEIELKSYKVFYFGRCHFWLDDQRNRLPQILVKIIYLTSALLHKIPFPPCSLTSPYIAFIGKK